MKLLLDQNISRRILKELEPHYPASTQVALIDLGKADDITIFQYAQKHNDAIVTKDSDFLELSLIHSVSTDDNYLAKMRQSKYRPHFVTAG